MTKLFYQVAHCYPEELSEFAQQLHDILQRNSTTIDPEVRLVSGNKFTLSIAYESIRPDSP